MMLISVIVPTYKPGKYIWECLDSLCNQTLSKSEFEVILVLNGCCEPWKSHIQSFIEKKMFDMNVNFIQTDIPGVSNARNKGLDVAKGEYIAFIDDDDLVSQVYLEELYEKSNVDTVALSYSILFKEGNIHVPIPYRMTDVYHKKSSIGVQPFQDARSYFSGPWMKLIHRDIIRHHRFDKRLRIGEDTTFMFVISDKIKFVDFTSKEAIYYRRCRENSAIMTKRGFKDRFKSNYLQIKIYTKYYLRGITRYSFSFYLSRCGGCLLGIFRS